MRNTRTLLAAAGIAATLDHELTRESCFTSLQRLSPSGVVLPHRRDIKVVVDVQEKRGANNESSGPLTH